MNGSIGIVCGLNPDGSEPLTYEAEEWEPPRCAEQLWRTLRPASTLWCPVHGHVIDCPPSPPLHLDALFVCR